MTLPSGFASRILQASLLRSASLLVPANERAEWCREWQAELWHVRQASTQTTAKSQQDALMFCLGAFRDAGCLRRFSWQQRTWFSSGNGSAAQTILKLAALLVVSYAIALVLPNVDVENHPSRYQVNPGLILIQDAAQNGTSTATIPVEKFRTWKTAGNRYIDNVAFYRLIQEGISAATYSAAINSKDRWSVAHASSNLFALLGLQMQLSALPDSADGDVPRVILSHEVWIREFGGDPNIAGQLLRVGQYKARVVGVALQGAWRLPGKVDAWLLQPDSEIAAGGLGYAVAHLTAMGQSEMLLRRVQISTYNSDEDLWGVSFEKRTQGPWEYYLFTVFMAFLALPFVTSVSLSEYNFSSHKPSWSRQARRAAFMIAKIALLLPIVYFSSLDVAYAGSSNYSSTSVYIQLVTSFTLCLFGLRWALLDQLQRCPVCLGRMTHPAHVGIASQTFLGWNGTESICREGHTLLHIPGLPTSWFSAQRWLYLDTSWKFLFAESRVG
jgi:hypothetical protein